MSILQQVYDRLLENPNASLNDLNIYHSDVYYCRAALEAKFNRSFSLEEVDQLMKEELES